MASLTLNSNTTYKFQLTATKNGAAWDITGATVTLFFHTWHGAVLAFNAGIDNGPGGVASYTCLTTDLVPVAALEPWSRTWQVSIGGTVVGRLGPIPFNMALVP